MEFKNRIIGEGMESPDQLLANPKNWRTHPQFQQEALTGVLKEVGYVQRVIVNQRTGYIVDGHARVMIAMREKAQIPVLYVDLSEEEEALVLATLDPIGALAGKDDEQLRALLDEVSTDDPGLQALLDSLQDGLVDPEVLNPGLTDEDAVPELQPEPVTKLGDVWVMGGHRLMCGSSTDQHCVDTVLAGQSPNTMITDPPYGVKYEADWRAKAKGVKATDREKNSSLKNDDRADWYDAYVLFPGAVAYVWHADAFTDVVMDGLRRAGFKVKQQIIWNKNVHTLSRSDYHWKHEPCWYAVKPDCDRNWKGGRTQMTVWDIKSVIFEDGKTAHPTQKPVEIYTRALEHHTNPGEYVYEPFGGSGTSIIACEKLGRRSLTMELDPKYCDVIVKRWQDFTGQVARLEGDSRTFDELSSQRECA